uniref:Uncharacterized protein n=1 Tax=Meloidogyne hapla TaxID=6305 RepID=A0A1I8B9K8_MELHA
MPNDQFANYTIQCLLSANYVNILAFKIFDESTSTIEIVKEVNLEEEVYQDQKLYESFTNNLGLDGILTLMLIHSNAGPRMVSQITGYMFKKYIEEKKK